MSQPAIFLDRDGTLIHDADYLTTLDDLHWYPWTIDALRLLRRAGYLLFVVTNQSGIARGVFTEDFVHTTHRVMAEHLARGGASIDGWFYCPHHVDGIVPEYTRACDCRKPGIGMVRQAQEHFDIDLAQSFVIGDKITDRQMGEAMGGRGILIGGEGDAANLMAAAAVVLGASDKGAERQRGRAAEKT